MSLNGCSFSNSCSRTEPKTIRAARSCALCQWRTFSRPQSLHSGISLWTPFPHDPQGTGTLQPLRILARWILQYSHKQLFPQTSVSPLLSQEQRLWPFIILVYGARWVYLTLVVFLNGIPFCKCNWLFFCCEAAWVGGPPGGWGGPFPANRTYGPHLTSCARTLRPTRAITPTLCAQNAPGLHAQLPQFFMYVKQARPTYTIGAIIDVGENRRAYMHNCPSYWCRWKTPGLHASCSRTPIMYTTMGRASGIFLSICDTLAFLPVDFVEPPVV